MFIQPNNKASIYSLSRSLNSAFAGIYKSLEKLSSGFSINSAVDGPADLIISEQFRARIASLNQEIENTTMSIAKYNTASSSLSEIRTQLTELRSLALGAANEGVNDEAMQQAYADSAENIVSSVNLAIAKSEFNGMPLLDGSESSLADIDDLMNIDLSSAAGVAASIEVIDAKINEIDSATVDIGATQKYELESQLRSMRISRENLMAAESNLRATDYAMEYTNFIVAQFKAKASLALLSHYRISSQTVLSLFD